VKRAVIAAGLLLSPVFLVGCGSQGGVQRPNDQYSDVFPEAVRVHVPNNEDGYATKFEVDGTPCISYDSGSGASITCDWQG
jgi:hypothetical protein